MEESPKFSHGVLNRGTCEEQSVSCVELKKYLPSTTEIVLYSLGLIEDHVVPLHSQQFLLILRLVHNEVIRGKQYIDPHIWVIEVFWVEELPQLLSFFWATKEGKDFQ